MKKMLKTKIGDQLIFLSELFVSEGRIFQSWRKQFGLKIGFNLIKGPILVNIRTPLIVDATFQKMFCNDPGLTIKRYWK